MRMRLDLWAFLLCIFGQAASDDSEIIFQRRPGHYLGNYMIRSLKTESEFDCSYECFNKPECVSVNFKVEGKNKGLCELNSETLEDLPEEGQSDSEYVYFQVDTRVRNYQLIYNMLKKYMQGMLQKAYIHSVLRVYTYSIYILFFPRGISIT